VLHQKVWAREKLKRTSGYPDRKRAIEDKESHRWLESLKLTEQWIPPKIQVVTVADREADIYELFAIESLSDVCDRGMAITVVNL